MMTTFEANDHARVIYKRMGHGCFIRIPFSGPIKNKSVRDMLSFYGVAVRVGQGTVDLLKTEYEDVDSVWEESDLIDAINEIGGSK